jgi:uncharacterized pyridoxal phosphate-containing UPF0001 family protein
MAIPEPAGEVERRSVRRTATARTVRRAVRAQGLALDTLSMGMSADLEAAVTEGATLVRVGTAIFGARRADQPALQTGQGVTR